MEARLKLTEHFRRRRIFDELGDGTALVRCNTLQRTYNEYKSRRGRMLEAIKTQPPSHTDQQQIVADQIKAYYQQASSSVIGLARH